VLLVPPKLLLPSAGPGSARSPQPLTSGKSYGSGSGSGSSGSGASPQPMLSAKSWGSDDSRTTDWVCSVFFSVFSPHSCSHTWVALQWSRGPSPAVTDDDRTVARARMLIADRVSARSRTVHSTSLLSILATQPTGLGGSAPVSPLPPTAGVSISLTSPAPSPPAPAPRSLSAGAASFVAAPEPLAAVPVLGSAVWRRPRLSSGSDGGCDEERLAQQRARLWALQTEVAQKLAQVCVWLTASMMMLMWFGIQADVTPQERFALVFELYEAVDALAGTRSVEVPLLSVLVSYVVLNVTALAQCAASRAGVARSCCRYVPEWYVG
jgi:hypothetical protein